MEPSVVQELRKMTRLFLITTYSAKSNQELEAAQQWLTQANSSYQCFPQVLMDIIMDPTDERLQTAAVSFLKVVVAKDCLAVARMFEMPMLPPKIAKKMSSSVSKTVESLPQETRWMLLQNIFQSGLANVCTAANLMALSSALIAAIQPERENISRIISEYFPKVFQLAEILMNRMEQTPMSHGAINQESMANDILMLEITIGVFEAVEEIGHEDDRISNYINKGFANERFTNLVLRALQFYSNSPGVLLIPHPQCEVAHCLNNLKALVMRITHTLDHRPDPELFKLCYRTFLVNNADSYSTAQQTELLANIISTIERFSLMKQNHSLFGEGKVELVMTCLNYSYANESEIVMVMDSPTAFVDLANDFCDSQELDTPKIRTSSLIAALCHSIDGFLSYLVEIVLKMAAHACTQLEKQQQADLPQFYLKTFVVNPPKELLLENLGSYPYSQLPTQKRLESCLLVLASIVDHLQRRNDILSVVMQVIPNMPVHLFDEVSASRFLLLASSISHKGFVEKLMEMCFTRSTPMLEHQIRDALTKTIAKFGGRHNTDDEVNLIIRLCDHLLETLPCWNPHFEIIVERREWSDGDLPFVEKLFQQFVKQSDDMLAEPIKLELGCLNLCRLIQQLKFKQIPASFQSYLRAIIDKLLPTCSANDHLVNVAVTWLDSVKQVTPELFNTVGHLLAINTNAELINRLVFYSQSIDPQQPITQAIISKFFGNLKLAGQNETVMEAALLLELTVLKLSAPHQLLFSIIQQVLAQYYGLSDISAVLLIPKLLRVIMSVFYRFEGYLDQLMVTLYWRIRADLIHPKIVDVVEVGIDRDAKIYAIYLMKLALFEAKLKSVPDQMLAVVLRLFKNLEMPLWKRKDKMYDGRFSGVQELLLKDLNMKHPFDPLNQIDIFRTTWQSLSRDIPQLKESKQFKTNDVLQLLTQRRVGSENRTVVRIKRQ